jgi:alpha-acetolactate decarboxylase
MLGIAPAIGQQHTSREPYALETFGMFRSLILNGDFTPKVTLRDVMDKEPTTGVGALADAKGEITIFGGRLIVSYGKVAPHPSAEDEAAALLAVGTVSAWQSVVVDHDLAPGDLEAFIGQTAIAHGVRSDVSFPFQIRGTLMSYVMHVNAAPTNRPHGMGQPIAVTAESKGDAVEGTVAGFYVSPDLVGIVSHGGTRTHSHWVALDGNSTAHLDQWGLKRGAVLLLPRP